MQTNSIAVANFVTPNQSKQKESKLKDPLSIYFNSLPTDDELLPREEQNAIAREMLEANHQMDTAKNSKSRRNAEKSYVRLRNELVLHNSRIAVKEAMKYTGRDLELPELIGLANIALVECVNETYDPRYAVGTYMKDKIMWVIERALKDVNSMRFPSYVSDAAAHFLKKRKPVDDKGSLPSEKEIPKLAPKIFPKLNREVAITRLKLALDYLKHREFGLSPNHDPAYSCEPENGTLEEYEPPEIQKVRDVLNLIGQTSPRHLTSLLAFNCLNEDQEATWKELCEVLGVSLNEAQAIVRQASELFQLLFSEDSTPPKRTVVSLLFRKAQILRRLPDGPFRELILKKLEEIHPAYPVIIRDRYFSAQPKGFREIARDLEYSSAHIEVMEKRALIALDELLSQNIPESPLT